MNHIIRLVWAALCGRREKSLVAGRIQIEPLRRFVVIVLLTISVTGAFLTTPGHVLAAQGYYEPLSSTLYLWGADLTEQTKIPDTVVGALQTLGGVGSTLATISADDFFRFSGVHAVNTVVIAKADISGYPIAAGWSGDLPTDDGVLTIGDGITPTFELPSAKLELYLTKLLQNDGTINITEWAALLCNRSNFRSPACATSGA